MMHMEKLQLYDVRYTPEREGFEAVVRVHENGEVFAYPAFVAAPLNAEFRMIAKMLSHKARVMHKGNATSPALRQRRGPVDEVRRPVPGRNETARTMMQMLKSLAA